MALGRASFEPQKSLGRSLHRLRIRRYASSDGMFDRFRRSHLGNAFQTRAKVYSSGAWIRVLPTSGIDPHLSCEITHRYRSRASCWRPVLSFRIYAGGMTLAREILVFECANHGRSEEH